MSVLSILTKFSAIDKMSAPLRAIGNRLSMTEERAAKLQRSFRKVGESSKKLAIGAGIGAAALIAPLVMAGKAAIDFEKQMSNISTIVDTSKESMSEMGASVLELSTKIPLPLEDLTSALYDVRSAGIPAAQALDTLEGAGRLATAGLSTAGESTDIMTSAMNAFKSEGLEAEEIANILFKTVQFGKTTVAELSQGFGATASIIQSAGVKLSDFQAATAALTTVGVPASQAQIQLKASISALQKPTAEMTKVFKALGVTSEKELIKRFGTLGGSFDAINSKGKELGVNMAKAWSSTQALSAVTSIGGATNEAYVKTLESMESGVNTLDEAFNKQMATGASQAQIAQNNIQALTVTIGTQLIPIFTSLIKKIKPVIDSFMTWARENPAMLKTIVKVTVGIAAFLLVLSGAATVISAVTVVMGAFGIATFTALLPILAIIAAVAALIALVYVIIKYWEDWGAALAVLLGPLGMIISLIMSFKRNWDMITDAFKNEGILSGLLAIGKTIFDAILMPLQQGLELMEKWTGMDLGSSSLMEFRSSMGVNMGDDAVAKTAGANFNQDSFNSILGGTLPTINPKEEEQNSLVEKITNSTNKETVDLNVNVNGADATVETTGVIMPKLFTTQTGGQ